jgi:hypothetical protein
MVTVTKTDNRTEYDRLLADLKELHGSVVKVGFPDAMPVGDATESKSNKRPYESMSEVARIAAWLEFGVPAKDAPEGAKKGFMEFWHIPPRPFFRQAIDGCREQLGDFMDRTAIDVELGHITPKQAFERVGIFMQDKIKKSITDTTTPPNAPSTIKAKGSSHPLIDSGQMRNSVTFVTVKAGVKTSAGESLSL